MTSIIAFENDNGIIIGGDMMIVNGDYIEMREKGAKISDDCYIFVSGDSGALDALVYILAQRDDIDKKFIETGEFDRIYMFNLCQRVSKELNVMVGELDGFCLLFASKKGIGIVDSTGYITPTPMYNFIGIGIGRYSTVAYMDSYAHWTNTDMRRCSVKLLESPIQKALEYTSSKVDGVRGSYIYTISKDNQ